MKLYLLSLVFSVTTALYTPFDSKLDEHWDLFKKTFNKQYNIRENVARRLIWEGKVSEVVRHNLRANMGLHNYTKGINEYSDISHSNFVKSFNGLKHSSFIRRNGSAWMEPSNVQFPDKIDWRDAGFVTPVKNQNHCGSCWAFVSIGSLEGQYKKKTGQLVSLSEQNLIDCSQSYGNKGCHGGYIDKAFEYIKENNGVDTEESYPYTGVDTGECLYTKAKDGAVSTGYIDLPSGDENALMKAVATVGPIAVGIDASHESFHLYSGGIYDEPECDNQVLDHGVLVIGYGSEHGKDFWIIKNSWGTSWGENGYGKMSRNKGNQCGIATIPSYPLV